MIKIIKEKGIIGRQAAHAWVRQHNIYDRAYYVYNKKNGCRNNKNKSIKRRLNNERRYEFRNA